MTFCGIPTPHVHVHTKVTVAFPIYIPQGIPPSKRFAPLAKPGNTMLGTSINTTKSQKPKTKVPARAVSSQPTKNRAPPKQCVAAVKNPKQVHVHAHVQLT